jgi:hypothetical protein
MSKAEGTTLTDRQQYWLRQVRACEASGKTVAEYAAEQGFSAQAMYAGKKLLVRKGVLPRTRPSRLQRVQVAGVAVGNEWRIQLPNGVSVSCSGVVEAGGPGHVTGSGGAGMMRPANDLPAVYLCCEVVDFRKGINGLAILVEEALQLDPFPSSCSCSATASALR